MVEIITNLTLLAMIIIIAILAVMVVAFLATLSTRNKYKRIEKDLEKNSNKEEQDFRFGVLTIIIEEYKKAAKSNPNEVNTQAIIEKNFHRYYRGLSLGERFIKSSVSIMIILGLLGTFYGLTLSIGELVNFLSKSANADVLNSVGALVDELISSVQGMSVAFITSLFGIAASIIITVTSILFSVEDSRESLLVRIEEYLDNNIALKFTRRQTITDAVNTPDLDLVLGQELNKFADNIELRLKNVFDNLGDQLTAAAVQNSNSVVGLQNSIETFEKSLLTFSENTRDFTEFNHNLRTNIERMDVSFADLVQSLRTSTKDYAKTNETITGLTQSIEKLSNKL